MLVGQQVPFKKNWAPTTADLEKWKQYQSKLAEQASSGFSVKEAVKMIRSDQWGWKPDFYTKAVRW